MVVELAVKVAEVMEVGCADELACLSPFLQTDVAEIRMTVGVHAVLTGRQRDEMKLAAGSCFKKQSGARPEGLVVRVGKNAEDDLLHNFSIIAQYG